MHIRRHRQVYGNTIEIIDTIDFPANNNNSVSFRLKQQVKGKTGNSSTKNVEIMVSLKYLSTF